MRRRRPSAPARATVAASPSPSRSVAARAQHGATLLEILVVIAVMVPVILAASLGLLTTMRLSASTKTHQELDAAATSFAESLKEVTYVPCAGAHGYDGASSLWTPPTNSPITVEVAAVTYWSQSSKTYTSAACTTDGGAQSIDVVATKGARTSRLTVVKRNPTAHASTP